MLRVQFQNPLGLDAAFRLHHLEILFHLKAETFPSRQAHGMGLQPDSGLHLAYGVSQRLLHEGEHVLVGVGGFLGLFLSGFFRRTVHGGAEFLILVGVEDLGGEFVHLLREVQDLHALILQGFQLGQLVDLVYCLTGGVVNDLLILFHPGNVLVQRHQLLLRGGIEQQQILQKLLVSAIVCGDAVFDLAAEVLPEDLIALPLVLEHLAKLALDLLFQICGNDFQLPVMLQQLPRDIQAQVGGVHHAPDEPEMLRQQVGAFVHDENAAGIELQSLFVLLGVVVEGSLAGDEQQRLIGHSAFGGHGNDPLGVLIFMELVPIELVVLLRLYAGLLPLPDRHHGVQGLHLGIGLILRLVVGAALLFPGLGDGHADGEADIVGVFLHKVRQRPLAEVRPEIRCNARPRCRPSGA